MFNLFKCRRKELQTLKFIASEIRETNHLLRKLIKLLTPEKATQIWFFVVDEFGNKQKVEDMFLKVSQSLPLSIQIKDKGGNDAKVDGVPAWAVDNAALATLVVAEDGMSAVVTPSGVVGSFKVQVSADADLGPETKTIIGELAIDLVAGDAVSIAIAAGEPSDIPPVTL